MDISYLYSKGVREMDLLDDERVKAVVIDPGHGGDDPGAISGNLKEKDFNLKVSNYMYDRFKQLGVPVAITRNTDTTLSRDERVNKVLNAFGDSKDVVVVANHINSGGGDSHCVTNV